MDLDDEELKATREKTGEEILLELGYIKHDNHPEQDEPIEPNTFVTQDVRQLYYEQKGVIDGMDAVECIHLDLLRHNIVVHSYLNGKSVPSPLNNKEIIAIHKIMEERGWL